MTKKNVALSSKLGEENHSIHSDRSAVEQKDSGEFVLIRGRKKKYFF